MAPTKLEAWTLFKADKLGQTEGRTAIEALTKEDFDAYEETAAEFEFDLARLGIEAQNEAAGLWDAHPNTKIVLEAMKPYDLTADHYWSILSVFKGSKYERLHLSAMFRVANAELLLELVKPS